MGGDGGCGGEIGLWTGEDSSVVVGVVVAGEGGTVGADQRELLSQSGTFFFIILNGNRWILRLGFLDFHFSIRKRRDELPTHLVGFFDQF